MRSASARRAFQAAAQQAQAQKSPGRRPARLPDSCVLRHASKHAQRPGTDEPDTGPRSLG